MEKLINGLDIRLHNVYGAVNQYICDIREESNSGDAPVKVRIVPFPSNEQFSSTIQTYFIHSVKKGSIEQETVEVEGIGHGGCQIHISCGDVSYIITPVPLSVLTVLRELARNGTVV
jgi:hypothetical protein